MLFLTLTFLFFSICPFFFYSPFFFFFLNYSVPISTSNFSSTIRFLPLMPWLFVQLVPVPSLLLPHPTKANSRKQALRWKYKVLSLVISLFSIPLSFPTNFNLSQLKYFSAHYLRNDMQICYHDILKIRIVLQSSIIKKKTLAKYSLWLPYFTWYIHRSPNKLGHRKTV